MGPVPITDMHASSPLRNGHIKLKMRAQCDEANAEPNFHIVN